VRKWKLIKKEAKLGRGRYIFILHKGARGKRRTSYQKPFGDD
jgi:hypothetical protein